MGTQEFGSSLEPIEPVGGDVVEWDHLTDEQLGDRYAFFGTEQDPQESVDEVVDPPEIAEDDVEIVHGRYVNDEYEPYETEYDGGEGGS